MVTEKDLYTGLQFKFKHENIIYTLDLTKYENVTWEKGKITTHISIQSMCNNINNGCWILINKVYELW